jgi:protein involved in polysaccharide export with SLBB domain
MMTRPNRYLSIAILTALLMGTCSVGVFAQNTQSGTNQQGGQQIPAGLTQQQWQQLQQFQMQQSGGGNVATGAQNAPGASSYDPTTFMGEFTIVRMQQELTRRNVTREELRRRLARKGILLENIQEVNLPRYRDVIMQTIIEIQSEKMDVQDAKQQALEQLLQELQPSFELPASVRTVTEEDLRIRLLEKGIIYENIRPDQFPRYERIITETLLELQTELDVLKREEELNKIYGHSIFKDNTLEVYRLTEGASATSNYILGTNDIIRVTIFGVSQADLVLEVNTQGYVQPQNLSQIYVRGMSVAQARELLRQRLRNVYEFNPNQIVVTVQETRPISVSVIGEVQQTGTYYLSAMNSVFNLMSVAGGPTPIGTVRRIEHIRGSSRSTVDVYKLMENPSEQYKFDLQNNDVINIPVAQKLVRIEGGVKRPMRYEMLDSETLIDLIRFAGGLAETANPNFVQIQRYDLGEVNLLEFSLRDVMMGNEVVSLQAGDVIRIRTTENLIQNKVVVSGMVLYPGEFGYRAGITVGEAISLAGGLRPAAFERAYIERRSLRDTTFARYVPVNLGTQDGMATVLEPNDNIMIYDRSNYSNVGELIITGAVKQTQRFSFDPDLTLYDLFTTAGGFAVGAAYNRVEVFRTTVYTDSPVSMELLTLELDENYTVLPPNEGFQLKPYDYIVVRQTPGFQLSRTVEINGEVEYPGLYPLESRQTHLSDIIREAGGLRTQADPIGSTLFRTQGDRGFIITNLQDVLDHARDEAYDPILFEGDVITIERRENIVTIRPTGTRVYSAIDEAFARRNLNLTFQGEKSAKWYIQNYAGGFDKQADKNSVTVTLKNGQVLATRRTILFIRRYPKVQSGSTIQVAMKPEKIPGVSSFDYDQFLTRTAQTTTSFLTILLLMQQLNSK